MSEAIPDGYKQDGKGRLVPLSTIKAIDIERDDLVIKWISSAEKLHVMLKDVKRKAMGDIEAFIQLSAEQYDVQVGGKKGNVTLMSFDGKYKMTRTIQDQLAFDERLQAAKALIDECIRDWSEGSNDKIMVLVNDAFQVDKQGQVNTGRILGLRRLSIDDKKWINAMQAISDSVTVQASTSYVRFYKRIDNTDKFEQLVLDLAGV